jgi:hypothetical protein
MQRDFGRLRLLGGILIFARGDRAFLRKFDALLIISSDLNFLSWIYCTTGAGT